MYGGSANITITSYDTWGSGPFQVYGEGSTATVSYVPYVRATWTIPQTPPPLRESLYQRRLRLSLEAIVELVELARERLPRRPAGPRPSQRRRVCSSASRYRTARPA